MTDIYELFKDEIWKPEDLTSHFWYEVGDTIWWSEEGECDTNPSKWVSKHYSDDIGVRKYSDGYVLMTVEDGYRDIRQAILDTSKKVEAP